MDPANIGYFAIAMLFGIAPAITFGFIYLMRRAKADVEKLRYKKDILELEIKKDEMHLRSMIEENRKLDRLIESKIRED